MRIEKSTDSCDSRSIQPDRSRVLESKVPHRVTMAAVSLATLVVLSLAVQLEVPSDRRGNLVVLTSCLWLVWLRSMHRILTVHTFGDGWLRVRTVFTAKEIRIDEIREVEVRGVHRTPDVILRLDGGATCTIEARVIERNPGVAEWLAPLKRQKEVGAITSEAASPYWF